jgi:hypothetical protein
MTLRSALFLFLLCLKVTAAAQTATTSAPTSDPQAVALITQSQAALTNGVAVTDVSLSATATWIVGSTTTAGTAALKAKGSSEARLDISGQTTRTELRNDGAVIPGGEWIGADGAAHHLPMHNCWSPAAWFSPTMVLPWASKTDASLSYIGRETRNGVPVDHIRIVRTISGQGPESTALIQHLTKADLYLDSASHLPVALTFATHPDNDAGRDIPVEIRYSDYRATNGIQVPFRVQRLLQNNLNLDLTITATTPNTGLSDSEFALQ